MSLSIELKVAEVFEDALKENCRSERKVRLKGARVDGLKMRLKVPEAEGMRLKMPCKVR
jgi:hypothetical protein